MIQDILIIGGGIHGTSIARASAANGLVVTLCEKNDLASGTSSMSSKLIHGGLRYLEQFAFRLVQESLKERENLMYLAPHLVQSQRFIIPHLKNQRPFWLLEIGLYLYDKLGQCKHLPRSSNFEVNKNLGLKSHFTQAMSYFDCTGDDARLVIANAKAARQLGAKIMTHHICMAARYEKNYWLTTLKNTLNSEQIEIKSRAIINASGIHAEKISTEIFKVPTQTELRLVKGSHIVIRRPFSHSEAFLIQNTDKRVVFVIPYLDNMTLIGTTDVLLQTIPPIISIETFEIDYLIKVYNDYFEKQITTNDIVQTYSGIRPLSHKKIDLIDGKNASSLSRDYIIEFQPGPYPPLINIFGGKLTTYRTLTEKVIKTISPLFPNIQSVSSLLKPLPGGQLGDMSLHDFTLNLSKQYPQMPFNLIKRLAKTYGSDSRKILNNFHSYDQLGLDFSHGLSEAEVTYLIKYEWAYEVEDILFRRTKLGYYFDEKHKIFLEEWLKNRFKF